MFQNDKNSKLLLYVELLKIKKQKNKERVLYKQKDNKLQKRKLNQKKNI